MPSTGTLTWPLNCVWRPRMTWRPLSSCGISDLQPRLWKHWLDTLELSLALPGALKIQTCCSVAAETTASFVGTPTNKLQWVFSCCCFTLILRLYFQGHELLCEIQTPHQWLFDVAWCPRNPSLISCSSFDGHVSIYSLTGGQQSTGPTSSKVCAYFDGI